jgi:Family of unknown function (DUF6328)
LVPRDSGDLPTGSAGPDRWLRGARLDTGDDTEAERLNRNFGDLLQELRVAQAGVQILFAFLLTLPFQARFAAITTFEKAVYIGALCTAAFAAATFIAPVAYHRVLFRMGRKPQIVRASHRLATLGLVFLFLAMMGAILLVTDFVLGLGWAIPISGVAAAWFVALWWFLPWRSRGSEPGPFSSSP